MVPQTVMLVVVREPMAVIPVVIMIVIGSPRTPPGWVISPVPGGTPNSVSRVENIPDNRPEGYVDNRSTSPDYFHVVAAGPDISGIRGFRIVWFNNIVSAIQSFIPDELYLGRSIIELLDRKNGHILRFVAIQGNPENNCVNIPVNIIRYRDIVNEVVPIQVEVVYS